MKKAACEAFSPLGRWLLGCALALLLAGNSAAAAEITQLRTERADDGVYLSAVLRFDLPAVVEEALLKGIPAFLSSRPTSTATAGTGPIRTLPARPAPCAWPTSR